MKPVNFRGLIDRVGIAEAARRVGVTPATIRRWRRERSIPTAMRWRIKEVVERSERAQKRVRATQKRVYEPLEERTIEPVLPPVPVREIPEGFELIPRFDLGDRQDMAELWGVDVSMVDAALDLVDAVPDRIPRHEIEGYLAEVLEYLEDLDYDVAIGDLFDLYYGYAPKR